MSESRVHLVISRYSFVREVTRLRENLARVLSLSPFLSPTREKRREKKGDTRSEVPSKTPRLKWWQHGGAQRRLPRRRERARLYREERNPAVTHGRIELFIVMAACSTASSLCVGVRGRRETRGGGGEGSASVGLFFLLSLSLLFLAHLVPCSHSLSSTLVSTNTDTRLSLSLFPGAVTQPLEPRNHYTRVLFLARAVPPLPRSLSRPFCSVRMQRAAHSWYTPLGVQHLPT